MRITKTFLLLGLAMSLVGCFSLTVSKGPGEKESALVCNEAWYLFNCIPLMGGNASPSPVFPVVCFRNDVKMEKLQRRLLDESASRGKQVENLVWCNYDTKLFTLPLLNFEIPIPYLLTYRKFQLSGELK